MPQLTDDARALSLTRPPDTCQSTGTFTHAFGGLSREENADAALRLVKNDAAAAGATHLVAETPIPFPARRGAVVENPPMLFDASDGEPTDPREPPARGPKPSDSPHRAVGPAWGDCGTDCMLVTGRAYRCN